MATYDDGGILPPGLTWAYNNTGVPERVTPGIGHMAAILLGPRPPFLVRLRRAWRVLRRG